MTSLHDELDRLADTQPAFHPDPALWDRGRRARRRARVVAGTAALTVVAVVGGLGSLSHRPDDVTPAARVPEGAIPSRILDVPSELGTTSVVDGLAVGRASVAFISGTRTPVVVTATDGRAHRLDLPGWEQDSIGLALSPDGRTLAWEQDVPSSPGTHLGTLNLISGSMDTHSLHPETFRPRELTWSPDSTWVAYVGDFGTGGSTVGTVNVAEDRSIPYDPRDGTRREPVSDLAVSNDGTLVVGRPGGGLFRWDETGVARISSHDHVGAGAWSPDGSHLALRSSPGAASYTLDVGTGEVLEHPFPVGTFSEAVVRPLGWIDDRLQVLLLQDLQGEGGELVVTTPRVDSTSTWRRSVGTVEAQVANSVTLAVDLVPDLDGTSTQALTHDFGQAPGDASPWRERAPYLLGGLLALLSGMAFVRMLRHQG